MSEAYETAEEPDAPHLPNSSVDIKTKFYRAALKARQAQDAAKVLYDKAKGEYRNVLKAAKKAGVSSEALTQTLAIRGLDKVKVIGAERDKLEMWEISGEIKGIGTRLFGPGEFEAPSDETDRDMANDRAYDRGHSAGLNGSDREQNPYDPGEEEQILWDRGWHAGQTAIGLRMPVAPRPRGNGSAMPGTPPSPAF